MEIPELVSLVQDQHVEVTGAYRPQPPHRRMVRCYDHRRPALHLVVQVAAVSGSPENPDLGLELLHPLGAEDLRAEHERAGHPATLHQLGQYQRRADRLAEADVVGQQHDRQVLAERDEVGDLVMKRFEAVTPLRLRLDVRFALQDDRVGQAPLQSRCVQLVLITAGGRRERGRRDFDVGPVDHAEVEGQARVEAYVSEKLSLATRPPSRGVAVINAGVLFGPARAVTPVSQWLIGSSKLRKRYTGAAQESSRVPKSPEPVS